MKLLVVTPTLGESPWLVHTASGVDMVRRAGIGIRWVIVCPGQRLNALGEAFPNAELVEERSHGLYSAINQGIQFAGDQDWEWFSYINDDDGLLPGFVEACSLATQTDADIIYGNVEFVGAEGATAGAVSACKRPADALPLFACGITPFTQQGTLVRRRVVEKLGGFDERLSHVADSEFWVRALLSGAKAVRMDAAVAYFRVRPGQLSKNSAVMSAQINAVSDLARSGGASLAARWMVLIRFRCENIARVLGRLKHSGRLSSRSLMAGDV